MQPAPRESIDTPRNEYLRERFRASIAVFFGGLLIYGLTLSRLPVLGDSINNLLRLLRLTPVETFSNPVWIGVGRLVLKAVPFDPLLVLHGLNAVTAAAVIALVFWFMSGVPHDRTNEEKISRFHPLAAQGITGLVSALTLALCGPFWFVAVRSYAQVFHALLLLGLLLLLSLYARRPRFSLLLAFAFLYGVALVDSAALIFFAPLFAVPVLALLFEHDQFTVRRFLALGLAFLAGCSLLLLQAWQFQFTIAYEWREFRGYGHVVAMLLKDHYLHAVRGVPRVGWLTIALFSLLPWIVLVPFARAGAVKRKSFWSSYLLCFLFTVFGVAVLANQPIAPWAQFGLVPVVVLPYLFVASWMGYLAGYWYILLTRRLRAASPGLLRARRGALALYLAALVAGLVWMALAGARQVSDRAAAPAMELARDVIANLQGRRWLVSNGVIDGLIRYAAYEAKVPLNVINLSLSQAPFHRKYVASLLDDPRLKSLALVGMGPLLEEWLEKHADAPDQMAVLTHADLWQTKGYTAVPNGVLFLGAPESAAPDALALREAAGSLYRKLPSLREEARGAVKPLDQVNDWVFSHYSKVANNLGVYLEDQAKPEAALEVYQTALAVDPENISALLNAFNLTQGQETETARDFEARAMEFERTLDSKSRLWGLAYHHGYVRHPLAFVQMGWSWALTGKAGAAIRDFQRAISLGGEQSHLRMALAAMYFREGMDQESEQTYFAMLEEDPDNTTAIMGLARIAMRRGDFDQARSYLARLLELRVPPDVVEFELAAMEILQGNVPQAVSMLEKLAEKYPENLRAPAILAFIEMDRGNEEVLARHVERLEKAKDAPAGIKLILAFVALRDGKQEKARVHLEEILRTQPDHLQALEMLAKLDMAGGRLKDSEGRIGQILAIDPGHAFGNMALGSLQYVRGEYSLAESSFLASIERQPTSDALNSLAWVYMSRGEYPKAQQYAARALKADARNVLAWDTLGESSLQLGDLELAERALVRASELRPDSPRIILHLAQLHEAKGDLAQSRKLVEGVLQYGERLPADLYSDLMKLSDRLK